MIMQIYHKYQILFFLHFHICTYMNGKYDYIPYIGLYP